MQFWLSFVPLLLSYCLREIGWLSSSSAEGFIRRGVRNEFYSAKSHCLRTSLKLQRIIYLFFSNTKSDKKNIVEVSLTDVSALQEVQMMIRIPVCLFAYVSVFKYVYYLFSFVFMCWHLSIGQSVPMIFALSVFCEVSCGYFFNFVSLSICH